MTFDLYAKHWEETDIEKAQKKFASFWEILPDDIQTTLDVGGGVGGFYYASPVDKRSGYVLLENSPTAINIAKKNGINVVDHDIEASSLPFDDNSFDLVMANHLLEHVRNPWAVLAEMTRVSKKYVFVYGPNFASLGCRLDLLRGRPIRQMALDKHGSVVAEQGRQVSHIYFITYRNIIYWASKLKLNVVESQVFWYKRYFLVRPLFEVLFKNWGGRYRILLQKKERALFVDDPNFKLDP